MSSRWSDAKEKVAAAAREMATLGLVTGASGNVSLRLGPQDSSGLIAITPSGRPYSLLEDGDIVVVDHEVEPVDGELAPSSEALLHVAIYEARPDVGAVIHTHSVFSSVLAVAGMDIPPIIDEMMIAIGGPVKVSEYAFPGTQELADNVVGALGERNAALIRNHGAVGVGRDLREALDICALVERLAQIFVYSSLMGQLNTLPADVVDTELSLFRMRRQST